MTSYAVGSREGAPATVHRILNPIQALILAVVFGLGMWAALGSLVVVAARWIA